MPTTNASLALRYAFAALSVAVATGLRSALNPVLGEQAPFLFCLLAVLLSAWVGGSGPALLAVALGGLSSGYFFLPPHGRLAVQGVEQQVGLGLYLLVG